MKWHTMSEIQNPNNKNASTTSSKSNSKFSAQGSEWSVSTAARTLGKKNGAKRKKV